MYLYICMYVYIYNIIYIMLSQFDETHFKWSFLYIPFLCKMNCTEVTTRSPCFLHPLSQQMDGWWDLSRGDRVFPSGMAVVPPPIRVGSQHLAPSWGVSITRWYWLHTVYIFAVYKTCMYVWTQEKNTRLPPSQFSCDPSEGKVMQEGSKGGGEEGKSFGFLWVSFISKTLTYSHS